jgi:putative nucleotidyltransferase with HDIG domain
MNRILFVDDDTPLLEGLRLRLRPLQNKWAMSFADTGGQALAEFQREPFDLIVSDIRMPGVQGTRLLRTVNERWPETVRIALSGVTDPKETLHLVPIAHQFLSKPCESPLLEDTIARCLAYREHLSDPKMRALVGRVRRLPPHRHASAKLQSLLSSDTPSVTEAAQIIAGDTVLTARILQMVSSAFFRRGKRIVNVEQAVAHLGMDALTSVMMTIEVFSHWPDRSLGSSLDLDRLQLHTDAVARTARALAAETSFADDAFLAGLLHDIGYWIFAHECPRELERAHAHALEQNIPMYEAERAVIGATHAEIGAYLLGIWGLPESVVQAVEYHHTPRSAPNGFNALAAVGIAHALVGAGDESVFTGALPPDAQLNADYLTEVSAPFDWNEAKRRASY